MFSNIDEYEFSQVLVLEISEGVGRKRKEHESMRRSHM